MQEVTMIEIDPVRALAAFRKCLAEVADFKDEALAVARKADDLASKRRERMRAEHPMALLYYDYDYSEREFSIKRAISRLEQEAKRAELALTAYRVPVSTADLVIDSEDGSNARQLREGMIRDQVFVDQQGPVIEKMVAEPIQPSDGMYGRLREVDPPRKKPWWRG